MKKYYIVCNAEFPEECLELVSADTQEELEEKVFEIFFDDILIEHANSMIINAGLLENFYEDEEGSFFDDINGTFRDVPNDYIDSCVRKNVFNFFKDKPEFAELYFNKYLDPSSEEYEFPREMYKFIFFNLNNFVPYIIKEVKI